MPHCSVHPAGAVRRQSSQACEVSDTRPPPFQLNRPGASSCGRSCASSRRRDPGSPQACEAGRGQGHRPGAGGGHLSRLQVKGLTHALGVRRVHPIYGGRVGARSGRATCPRKQSPEAGRGRMASDPGLFTPHCCHAICFRKRSRQAWMTDGFHYSWDHLLLCLETGGRGFRGAAQAVALAK